VLQKLLFLQAVHHVITATYPCTQSDACKLGALQVQMRYGDHNPAVHKAGFLDKKIAEFIPARLLRKNRKVTMDEWEGMLYSMQERMTGTSESVCRSQYMSHVQKWDFYGNSFFTAEQAQFKKLPKTVVLGIGCNGVRILKPDTKEMLMRFDLKDIYRWGFKPAENFYFEIKKTGSGSGPVYEFSTMVGNAISDLLTVRISESYFYFFMRSYD